MSADVKVARGTLYPSIETLQADLDPWLRHYNCERPHLGYRNQGQRPYDRLQQYLANPLVLEIGAAASGAGTPPQADDRQVSERSDEALAVPLTAFAAVYAVPQVAAP